LSLAAGADRVVAAARWGALACSLLLAAPQAHRPGVVPGAAALLALTLLHGTLPRRLPAAGALVPAVVCALSGGWTSPLLPCVLPPVLALGLGRGFLPAAGLSVATAAVVARLGPSTAAAAWLTELLLLAVVAAYARRLEARAVHDERLRIARDLHDQLGQDLSGLGFLIDSGADRAELRAAVADIVRGLRDTLAGLRADTVDDLDLADFLARVARRSGLAVSFSAGQAGPELVRIAQEAVVNAERHARASAVSVRVEGGFVEVRDDGVGLPPRPPAAGHYGLIGMRERAEAAGGALEIESAPGRGTTVRCRVEPS
jgi:signal transduction histidine kinase